MKKLAILAATEGELAGLRSWWESPLAEQSRLHYNLVFRTGGIGAVAACYSTYKCIISDKPDHLIWIGIAGAYDRGLAIGQVVEVVEDQLVDLQIEHADGQLTSIDHLQDLVDIDITSALHPATDLDLGLTKVRSITAQRVSGAQGTIDELIERYNPQIEQMEGAGFYFVCCKESVPCVQIRSISNYVEPRDRDQWQPALAIKNLHEQLKVLLLNARFSTIAGG